MSDLPMEKLRAAQSEMRKAVTKVLETVDPNNMHISDDSRIYIKDEVGIALFNVLQNWNETKA